MRGARLGLWLRILFTANRLTLVPMRIVFLFALNLNLLPNESLLPCHPHAEVSGKSYTLSVEYVGVLPTPAQFTGGDKAAR